MSEIWETEPGSLTVASVQDMLGDKIANRLVAVLPTEYAVGIEIAQLTAAAAAAIGAAAASGPLAIGAAVVALFKSIDSTLESWAGAVKAEIATTWTKAIDQLSLNLTTSAGGNILTYYQPADVQTLKRAQAFTSKKKGKIHKLETLVQQFKPGYVIGVKRPAMSDYIAATVPVLIFTGHPFGDFIRESIYSNNPKATIGPLSSANGWENANQWYPLGLVKWTGAPLKQWAITASQLVNAHGCPPLRKRILVAPGLCPQWGPYGEEQPFSPRMAAYAAGLYGAPPPDLDKVTNLVAQASKMWGLDPLGTGILELRWAREDLARRGNAKAGKPLGDKWPGPFGALVGLEPEPDTSDGEDAPKGGGGFGGMVGGISSGEAAGGGAGLLLAGGLAAAFLMKKRRR